MPACVYPIQNPEALEEVDAAAGHVAGEPIPAVPVAASAAGAAKGGVARSRDCYMAAITACHKEEDFPRALALLQHMRRKVSYGGEYSPAPGCRGGGGGGS